MKESPTKQRILDAAEELMLEKSFHSVGVKQILDAVMVPKGSFYHYFDSKEQFGVEMLAHYIGEASRQKRAYLLSADTEPNPLKRLFSYLEGSIDYIERVAGRFPCLALKLASEVSDLSESMRIELAKGFEEWIAIYQQVLVQAVDQNILYDNVDCASEAQLIQDLWSGATHRAVANRNADPVRHAVAHLKSRLNGLRK